VSHRTGFTEHRPGVSLNRIFEVRIMTLDSYSAVTERRSIVETSLSVSGSPAFFIHGRTQKAAVVVLTYGVLDCLCSTGGGHGPLRIQHDEHNAGKATM